MSVFFKELQVLGLYASNAIVVSDGCRTAPTLLWVTATYKLPKTVAIENSTGKLRNSAQQIIPLSWRILRRQTAKLIWQCSAEVRWNDGWASGHKRLYGPVAGTAQEKAKVQILINLEAAWSGPRGCDFYSANTLGWQRTCVLASVKPFSTERV